MKGRTWKPRGQASWPHQSHVPTSGPQLSRRLPSSHSSCTAMCQPLPPQSLRHVAVTTQGRVRGHGRMRATSRERGQPVVWVCICVEGSARGWTRGGGGAGSTSRFHTSFPLYVLLSLGGGDPLSCHCSWELPAFPRVWGVSSKTSISLTVPSLCLILKQDRPRLGSRE